MNAIFRKVFLLTFGLLLVATVYPTASFAQATEGIKVQPAVIEDNVKPGQTYNFTLTFTNIGAADRTFYIEAQDIKGLDGAGLPIFAAPGTATGYELSSWINTPKNTITIKAGDSATLSLSAVVPGSVSPGAHFGGIFISDQAPKLNVNGSGIGMKVGSIMSLTVAGNVNENASLHEFSTDKVVYSVPVVTFNTKIQNAGNVLVRPHGIVIVSDMFGRQVASLNVNDSAAPVFPSSERLYTALWQGSGFAFGRYEAVGSFSYGDSAKKTISGMTSFWILPLIPIIIFLGSIFGVVLFMYLIIRMYIRKKLRDMGINSGRADMDFYAKRYQRSGSRLIVITLFAFLFCVVFLGIIFLFFA